MHTVSITEVRQGATALINEAQRTHEPILVIQRSRPAVYLVDAETYEAMEREMKDLRYRAFWQEVGEARDEYRSSETRVYDAAEDLIANLGLDSAR
jgi:prevent-host-death family protein